ncbi:hypothetical protein D9756_000036 [Leucocoprinus leucothites]|uniref:Uncharacterized protein n=1 Tax=Leucocoprinus leucothites TaxID=201217 RepID=A0A8H5GEG3_9AGAR|nr:hypothetical protein D9756_000036 [Leucoagaricus leucothites]
MKHSHPGILSSSFFQCPAFIPSPFDDITATYYSLNDGNAVDPPMRSLDDEQDQGVGGAGITSYPFQPGMSQPSGSLCIDQCPLIGVPGGDRTMKYSTPPPGRRRISAPSQFGSNNTTSWHIPGPPPPPPGTAQPDGECTESSDPSPIAPSAAYFGQGPSPGPGYGTFGAGTGRPSTMEREMYGNGGRALPMPMAFHYPHHDQRPQQQQQQCSRPSASLPVPSQSSAFSTSTCSPPLPGQMGSEKAATLGGDEAAMGSGVIVDPDGEGA